MLINLRNALMAGKRLPYDAEVEYLESTGTQYVNTGIAGTNDLALEGDIYLSLSSGFSSNLPFGVKAGPEANDAQCCLAATYNSEKWIYLQRGVYGYDGRAKVTVSQDGWHYMYLSKSKAVIDNTSATATLPWNVSPENSEPVYIFGFNNNGVTTYAKARCSCFRIYENSVLVRDFIPVRKGTVGYLYDRVSGKLFGNAGTGDFVVGQDVVPVEYIESHGTEWIDTGVAFADNFRWAVDFNGLNVQKTIFGGRTSTTRTSLLYRYSSSEVVINVAQYSSTTTPFKLGNIASGRHCVECAINQNVGNVWLDGVQVYTNETIAGTYISGVSQALFADNFGSYVLEQTSSKLYKCQMWQSGTLARSFLPVRVGTEGALIDTLTRRIYRNAGTGAFTYGNDLKYPIPAE